MEQLGRSSGENAGNQEPSLSIDEALSMSLNDFVANTKNIAPDNRRQLIADLRSYIDSIDPDSNTRTDTPTRDSQEPQPATTSVNDQNRQPADTPANIQATQPMAIPANDRAAQPVAASETGDALVTLAEGEGAEPIRATEAERSRDRKKKLSLGQKVVAVIAAVAAATGIGFGLNSLFGSKDANAAAPKATTTRVTPNELDAYGTNEATGETLGIHDGYGETGMFLSEHKAGPYNFAAAQEISPLFDNDEVEMVNYAAHNQVESFADYLANLPEQLQPEQFRGKTILETEKILESLSDEDFTKLEKDFQQTMDKAYTRRVTLNGEYDNAYMRLKDPSKPATHDNMELVRSTTHESNLEVTEFYWLDKDGKEIGSMTIKLTPVYNEKGEIDHYESCMQAVRKQGSEIYKGLDEVHDDTTTTPPATPPVTPPVTPPTPPDDNPPTPPDDNPPTPTPTPEPEPEPEPTPTPTPEPEPEPTPTPDHPPKNEEEERKHAGEYASPLDVDPTKASTEAEHEAQEAANRQSVEKQKAEDAAAAAEAERAAAEQAEAESRAAAEAEQRRQAEQEAYDALSPEDKAAEDAERAVADAAAETATADAAEIQQTANEVTEQYQEEAAAAEQAQTEASQNEITSGAPGQAEAEAGTLDAGDFASIAQDGTNF